MRHHAAHRDLVNGITRLYREDSAPFRLVVTEGLRSVGVPVSDAEPREEIREEVAALVNLYCEAVVSGAPFRDILGPVFEEVSSHGGKQMSGQFFTPWELCLMTAGMHLHDWKPEPRPDGDLWGVHEPACGSGAMLLAFCAELAKAHGPGVLRMWRVNAIDLDLTLARTCALQLIANFAALPAQIGELEVWHGNTLSMEMRGCVVRMRPNPLLEALGLLHTVDRMVEQAAAEITPDARPTQLALFESEAA